MCRLGELSPRGYMAHVFGMKEFKIIDEQIEILKDRGLIFKDTNMARRYLLTNNYYNIIKC